MRLLLGIFVFLIWASVGRYAYVCEIKGLCNYAEEEEARAKTLDLILDDSIVYLKNYDQFIFQDGEVLPKMNENNGAYLDSLASILKSDSLIQLNLVGTYRPTEKGKSSGMFEDLGLARASAIRKLLLDRGISEDRISLDSKMGDGEALIQPIYFKLYTDQEGVLDEYAKIKYTLKDMTFSDANFEKDSPVFKPGEALINYMDSVKMHFEIHENDTLKIIGHCDSDGTDEYNFELGKNRAESAKEYIINYGITAPIVTESKGESEPTVPNDSDENMQKNRRVQFVIE